MSLVSAPLEPEHCMVDIFFRFKRVSIGMKRPPHFGMLICPFLEIFARLIHGVDVLIKHRADAHLFESP
ncbi:hypothetical protein [Aeromonas media]|uniref:hypothetical protein n=1 Tax=Aeromonas media TaxID=651 RepID=UPI0011DD50BA|nr:hypothetical protein [Aeromonas media]